MKLIKLPEGYIITSDEKPDVGQKYFSTDFRLLSWLQEFENEWGYEKEHKPNLALASIFHTELPQIEFDLSDEDANKIGYIDVEKLSKEKYKFQDGPDHSWDAMQNQRRQGFKDGFRKAQSLSDKMFSLEDMSKCWVQSIRKTHSPMEENGFTSFIKNLSKQWDIEIEMDKIPADRAPNGWDVFPKITDSKIKVTKIL